jgi:prepilin-type N-terminal cleavage/methylation domain-containing protein
MTRNMSAPRHQDRAFTLIELLVVVAIIALLVSILTPSLSRAREQSRRAACLSNLKQLGQAFQSYLHENGDALPAACAMPSVDSQNLDPNDNHPPIMDYLEPYARASVVFRCPSDTPGRTVRDTDDPNIRGKSYWETERTSYEYNRLPVMLMDVFGRGVRIAGVRVGDTLVKTTPPPPGPLQNWLNKAYDFFLLAEYDPFHGRRGNQEVRHTLYADFHVEEERHFPFDVDPNDPWNGGPNTP